MYTAEAENFHMNYRMKCDEETKKQAVEIERLRAEAERLREDFAMMIRRLAARLQMRTRGTLHEQADESLVASALDLMRRNGVDLSPLREHRLEQSALAATLKEDSNG